MINIPPVKSSTPIKIKRLAEVSRTWQVGQILNATTRQGGDALSNVLIQVGKHTLEAKTPVALKTGQDIKLLVKTLGGTQASSQGNTIKPPLLGILTPLTNNQGGAINNAPQITHLETLAISKLRQFIAVQQSFSQLQQTSQALLSNSQQKLPLPLKNWLSSIDSNLQIQGKTLTANQLKQHLLNSGVFLESKLLNTATHPNAKTNNPLVNDFKYQLLAIKSELSSLNINQEKTPLQVQSLTPAKLNQIKIDILNTGNNPVNIANKLLVSVPRPLLQELFSLLSTHSPQVTTTEDLQVLSKAIFQAIQKTQHSSQEKLLEQLRFRMTLLDLGQQVDQAISKITSLQLQPLSREADGLVLLLFNLIFKDSHEHFDLNFRIQQEENNTTQDIEAWEITLNFNFKTLGQVQSKVHLIENQVSTIFHTELEATMEKIRPLLPLLQAGLTKAGLKVLNIDVVQGLGNDSPVISTGSHLLDENI